MGDARKIKLLVTGASGFIGYEVSRQLSIGGYRPRLMFRYLGDDCDICKLDADLVQADLRKPQSLQYAVKGVDGIIHLGARATFESYETLKPSILDGSLALMQAGIEAGVRRFIYSSSLLVYSSSNSPVNANTSPRPALDYGRIKLDTERRLANMAAAAGVTFTALRLPHVYGIRDLYFRQLHAGRLILPGLGKNKYTHLHVTDAASAIITCAEQGYTGILPFGDRRPATWASFLEVAQKSYPKARIILLPKWAALGATLMLAPFRRFRTYAGLETPGAVRSYNFNLEVDSNLLWQDLSLSPQFPTIYEGIPAAVAARGQVPASSA